MTQTHDAANELTAISGGVGGTWISPVYDAAGNMTQAPKPGAETTRIWLKYDAWNRLAEVDADSGGSPGAALGTYRYDGLNRRISKTAGTDTLDYYYNENWQVLEVRKNGSSNPLEQWVWDQRYIDAPVLRWHDSNTDGTVDDTLYATNDANMNVTALVDTITNNVVERYAYDPYGKVTVMDGAWGARASSSYGWDVGHQGLMRDEETGLVSDRMRALHTSLGRFTGRDTLRYIDGPNLYQYEVGDPIKKFDPWGSACQQCYVDDLSFDSKKHAVTDDGGFGGEWGTTFEIKMKWHRANDPHQASGSFRPCKLKWYEWGDYRIEETTGGDSGIPANKWVRIDNRNDAKKMFDNYIGNDWSKQNGTVTVSDAPGGGERAHSYERWWVIRATSTVSGGPSKTIYAHLSYGIDSQGHVYKDSFWKSVDDIPNNSPPDASGPGLPPGF